MTGQPRVKLPATEATLTRVKVPATEATLTRVKLLATEATLTALGADTLDLATYRRGTPGRPLLSPADLAERVPELARFARVEPDADWGKPGRPIEEVSRELACRLQELFDMDEALAGAVVVHGTNVLEETAYFLHLVLKTAKPVVVVGAQRPFTALSSDGPGNLLSAVRVAATPAARKRGVLVTLNDRIHCARDVTKLNTYRLEAFQAPSSGPVGCVDPDRVLFHARTERLHTLDTPFRATELGELPRVEVLYDHAGADGGLVEAAIALGAGGLVIAGSGAGASAGMREALISAAARGITVVRSSRVGSGRVLAEDNHSFPGSVAAGDLNPQKSRVLLRLALTVTREASEIQELFDTC